MKITNQTELQTPRFSLSQFFTGLTEIKTAIEAIGAQEIMNWHRLNAKESDKSLSRCVNDLMSKKFIGLDWEADWSFCPSVSSNHATFEFSKVFDGVKKVRFAIDIGSRHSNEALGYLAKGQLARKNRVPEKRQIDAHVLLCFSQDMLSWGRWNSAVYSYEKFISNTPLMVGAVRTPVWILEIGEPEGLKVTTTLGGSLKVEKN